MDIRQLRTTSSACSLPNVSFKQDFIIIVKPRIISSFAQPAVSYTDMLGRRRGDKPYTEVRTTPPSYSSPAEPVEDSHYSGMTNG